MKLKSGLKTWGGKRVTKNEIKKVLLYIEASYSYVKFSDLDHAVNNWYKHLLWFDCEEIFTSLTNHIRTKNVEPSVFDLMQGAKCKASSFLQ